MQQSGNNSAEGRNNNGNGNRQPAKDDGPRVNDGITAPKVRLVGDNIPQPGIYPLREAQRLAESLELDLVEISAKVDPPVCKIIDYQKYVYQQKKKAKEMKSNASKVVIKEIRFGPNRARLPVQAQARHKLPAGRLEGQGVRVLQGPFDTFLRAGRETATAFRP